MVKNHKLARAISDAGWGTFVSMIEYKGELYGCELRRLDRFFPSSKRCSNWGYIKEDMTLNIREWDCPECLAHHDRDINAAKNILKFSQSTVGSTETYTPFRSLLQDKDTKRITSWAQEALPNSG